MTFNQKEALTSSNLSKSYMTLRNKKNYNVISFQGLLFLSMIAVAVNLMIFSTVLVEKDHRNVAAVEGQGPLLIPGRNHDDRIELTNTSQKSKVRISSQLPEKSETLYSNSISIEDTIKTAIQLNLQKNSSNFESSDFITTANKRDSGSSTSFAASSIPYYLKGKTQYKRRKFHRKKTFQQIKNEDAKPIDPSQKVWVLPDPVKLPTRNHETILLEYVGDQSSDKQILVNILGRYSRGVQWMDLETGEQRSVETNGTDPSNRPLNDLNHVASVLVDSIALDSYGRSKKEVWLPCGFHNDRVGKELSSDYVRIVDLETMEVRTGPKLPYSGGACGAAPIEAIPGEPPLVCAFGGTNGNHDTGIFLPYVSCFDRVASKWVYPFGKLPMGMDHLSVVVLPKATCHPEDPSRVLVFNFRTKNYSTHTSAEILAFDIPEDGWTRDELEVASADQEGQWYTFVNHTFDGGKDEAYAPRDASGVVMANGGRSIINFGGINQIRNPLWNKKDRSNGPKVFSTWYSTVRELDVCSKQWEKVADLGIQTFALMAAASTKLNTAFFCGGSMSRQDFNGNTELCLAIKLPGVEFWNHRKAAVENFPEGFRVGGRSGVSATAMNNDIERAIKTSR